MKIARMLAVVLLAGISVATWNAALANDISAARANASRQCWGETLSKYKWKPTDKPDTQQDATYRNCMAGHGQLP
jgi:hypothetical protein